MLYVAAYGGLEMPIDPPVQGWVDATAVTRAKSGRMYFEESGYPAQQAVYLPAFTDMYLEPQEDGNRDGMGASGTFLVTAELGDWLYVDPTPVLGEVSDGFYVRRGDVYLPKGRGILYDYSGAQVPLYAFEAGARAALNGGNPDSTGVPGTALTVLERQGGAILVLLNEREGEPQAGGAFWVNARHVVSVM